MDSLPAALLGFGTLGYLLLRHAVHRTRIRWDALEWQQNLFEATAVGLALFIVARLTGPSVHALIERHEPFGLHKYFAARIPFPYWDSLLVGTAFGLLLAIASNWIWSEGDSIRIAVKEHGGQLRNLLHRAHRGYRLVLLSLESRKAYAGIVLGPPRLREPSHVVLLPVLSGYRDPQDMKLYWRTDYSKTYLEMAEKGSTKAPENDPSSFELVIPLDTICSAAFFDLAIWNEHFAPDRRTGAGPAPPETRDSA